MSSQSPFRAPRGNSLSRSLQAPRSTPLALVLLLGCGVPGQGIVPGPGGDDEGAATDDGRTSGRSHGDEGPEGSTGILQADLTLSTEAGMVSFCDHFDAIGGDLVLAGSQVADTASLSCLVEVEGSLIVDDTALQDLDLPSLDWLGGDLRVSHNPLLVGGDLGGLSEVPGSVELSSNEALPDLALIALLSSVGGDLVLQANGALVEAVLPQLAELGGALDLRSNFDLEVFRLVNLGAVGGSVEIRFNDELEEVDLRSVVSVDGPLWIASCLVLGDLDLSSLEGVLGDLYIGANPSLPQLYLGSLTSAGAVRIANNPSMPSLDLQSLQTVAADLRLSDNPSLSQLHLPGLEAVGGSFELVANGGIQQLTMPLLAEVGDDFVVVGNTNLPTSLVQAIVDAVGPSNIGGTVTLSDNG